MMNVSARQELPQRPGGRPPGIGRRIRSARYVALAGMVLAVFVSLGGCREYEYDPRDLENDLSEALIRHMLAELPELEPQVPKIYTITLSEGMAVPRRSFVDRFDDLGIKWVSGNQLIIRSEDNRVIDAETRLSPITFQVTAQELQEDGSTHVTGAWAYKDIWQRRVFIMRERPDGGYDIEPGEVLEQSETLTL